MARPAGFEPATFGSGGRDGSAIPEHFPRLALGEALSPDREWKRLARRLGNGAGGYDPREAFAQLVTKIRG